MLCGGGAIADKNPAVRKCRDTLTALETGHVKMKRPTSSNIILPLLKVEIEISESQRPHSNQLRPNVSWTGTMQNRRSKLWRAGRKNGSSKTGWYMHETGTLPREAGGTGNGPTVSTDALGPSHLLMSRPWLMSIIHPTKTFSSASFTMFMSWETVIRGNSGWCWKLLLRFGDDFITEERRCSYAFKKFECYRGKTAQTKVGKNVVEQMILEPPNLSLSTLSRRFWLPSPPA